MKNLEFKKKLNHDLWMEEITLCDDRTRDIDLQVLEEINYYVKTPRVRRKLDASFVDRFEFFLDELIDASSEDKIDTYIQTMKMIYELLYLEYPDIKRKFYECMRKRKSRLDEKGRTKWEVRRKSIAMKKGAVTKKKNIKSKINDKERRLYNFFNEITR